MATNDQSSLTPQQSHKLHIVYLMLTSVTIQDTDFDQPSKADPQKTNGDVISDLLNDVPGAADALDSWLHPKPGQTYGSQRDKAKPVVTAFIQTAGGNAPWGGPNGCPKSLSDMISWLQSVDS